MEKVHVQANFIPQKGMFLFQVNVVERKQSLKVEMTPDQFLGMAQYVAKVGVSYQEWLKNGGK